MDKQTESLQTVEYYLVIKRSKWMNLECVMLSEVNHSQKTTYCVTPIYMKCAKGQIHRDRKWIGSCRGWGVMVNRHVVSV